MKRCSIILLPSNHSLPTQIIISCLIAKIIHSPPLGSSAASSAHCNVHPSKLRHRLTAQIAGKGRHEAPIGDSRRGGRSRNERRAGNVLIGGYQRRCKRLRGGIIMESAGNCLLRAVLDTYPFTVI